MVSMIESLEGAGDHGVCWRGDALLPQRLGAEKCVGGVLCVSCSPVESCGVL
jgi:hypothetical protein